MKTYEFGLEFKTALDKALDGLSTFLLPQIVIGEGKHVFNLELGNLNKIRINVYCPNGVNSTGGIMPWEVKFGVNLGTQEIQR